MQEMVADSVLNAVSSGRESPQPVVVANAASAVPDRKAREESAASMDVEPTKRPAELNEGQPEKQGETPASSDRRAFEDPDDGVGKDEAA